MAVATLDPKREAIITLLKEGIGVNMDADLSCYPSAGLFLVDYIFMEETINKLNLTEKERNLCLQEEELVEFFDKPEDAVDFYLRLSNGNFTHGFDVKKRSLKDKLKKTEKDAFFD